jgi:hypothetical protein
MEREMKPYVLATMSYKNGRKESRGLYDFPKKDSIKMGMKYARMAYWATGIEPTMPNMHLCVNGFTVLVDTKKIMDDEYLEKRILEII